MPADLAGGNQVSASTIRWVLEAIGLLAARAPRLERALKKIKAEGADVVLVDGTLVRTRRRTGKDNRKNYSGKAQSTRPAVPRPHRDLREPHLDLRRETRQVK
jgi:hypothetical protein